MVGEDGAGDAGTQQEDRQEERLGENQQEQSLDSLDGLAEWHTVSLPSASPQHLQ